MVTTIIAVLGTLLGSIVTGLLGHLSSGRAERARSAERLRHERIEAITLLAAAGADYRRAMRKRAQARLTRAGDAHEKRLRDQAHVVRSALTGPLTLVKVLIPDPCVQAAAQAMVQAAYEIRDSTDSGTLTTKQTAALVAHDEFVDVATRYVNR